MADNHRVAAGDPRRRIEAEIAQLSRKPFRRPAAFVLIGGIRRDARNLDECEETLEALLNIGIDAVEYGGEMIGHGISSLLAPKDRRRKRFSGMGLVL
jgi:hypothetical protein